MVGRGVTTPPRKKFLVTKPHRYVRWPRFFKNCRATDKEEGIIFGGRYKL
jgi:hypothetical protein